MKIKALVEFATISAGYRTGEIYEVPCALGKQWIAARWVEEVKPQKTKSRRKTI